MLSNVNYQCVTGFGSLTRSLSYSARETDRHSHRRPAKPALPLNDSDVVAEVELTGQEGCVPLFDLVVNDLPMCPLNPYGEPIISIVSRGT